MYKVTVTDLTTGDTETVTVEGDGFRDAALTAAETPFDLWSGENNA